MQRKLKIISLFLLVFCMVLYYLFFENHSWFLEGVALSLSILVSSVFFNSYIVLFFIFILVIGGLLYNPIRKANNDQIISRAILCFVVFFLVLIPFKKGYEFHNLEEFGLSFINKIENFNHQNKRYPNGLSELQKELTTEEYEIVMRNFNYCIPKSGKYVLRFAPDGVKHSYYVFIKREHKFIGFD